jgi:hypothetical protein
MVPMKFHIGDNAREALFPVSSKKSQVLLYGTIFAFTPPVCMPQAGLRGWRIADDRC